jgi:L-aminopeptidase/D-esterase-like protein
MIRQNHLNRRGLLRTAAFAAAATAGSKVLDAGESHGSIIDVGNLRVGHFTDKRRPTGCTVVLFERGAVAGVDVKGSAPGTRETDLLQPVNTVERVNAILLSGGSAFGLDACSGVMRYLEENNQGYHMGPVVVPIVPAAILFDLNVGDSKIRPDAEAGYAACRAAKGSHVEEGNVGAGAGATVGKFFGLHSAMKSGIGTASIAVGNTGIVVGAIVAVNAVGDVFDARTGKILAGALMPGGGQFRDTVARISAGELLTKDLPRIKAGSNTTIGVAATNAVMSKTQMAKVAQMAHDGLARSINPVHTAADGDTIFAAATGTARTKADVTTIGVVTAEAMALAVQRAVLTATSIPGYLAHCDLPPNLR